MRSRSFDLSFEETYVVKAYYSYSFSFDVRR